MKKISLKPLVIVAILTLSVSVLAGCSRKPTGQFHRSYFSAYPYQAQLATSMKTALKLEKNTPKVQVQMNKGVLAMSSHLPGANIIQKEKSIVFSGENTDIEYTLLENGIQEEIIIKEKTETNQFSSQINLKDLTYREQDNTIRFYNAEGEYVFEFAEPYAIDASGNKTTDVTYVLTKNPDSENTYTLIKEVDPDWLFGKQRSYPIIIDPTIITIASSKTPTLSENFFHDNIITNDTTPLVKFGANDPESDDLRYEINWDTDSDFVGASTADSSTDPGFANEDTPADTSPFTSNETITYTFQSALTNNTTYYWRVRARDPSGDDTWSSWSDTRSFTVNISTADTTWFQTVQDQFSTDYYTSPVNVNTSDVTSDDTSSSSRYYQEATITNGGSLLTNHAVLVEIDTATLVSALKLSSDCSDLRVGSDQDGQTTLDFWIEQGCNTSTTQVWVEVPSVPAGDTTIYFIYGDVTGITDSEVGWAGNFIVASNAACAGSWSSDATMNSTFPRGNTSYGTTGGSATHAHTGLGDTTSYTGGNGTTVNTGSGNSGHHSHTFNNSTGNASSLPPYLDFVFCTQASPVELIDTQYAVHYDSSVPSGWSEETSYDDYFVRGNSSYGGTGGSATHYHSYSFSIGSGANWNGKYDSGGSYGIASSGHTHSVSGNTSSAGSIPSYYGLYVAYPDANDSVFGTNAIMAFDTAPPLGWTQFSELDEKFVRIKSADGTVSGDGNSAGHAHSFSGTTGGSSGSISVFDNNPTREGTGGHTHTYSGTTDASSPLPPYKDLLYYERNDDGVTVSLGSEQNVEGLIQSTAITADYLGNTEGQWDSFSWNDDESNGDIQYKIYYDNNGNKTIIPDGVLAGNSTGFDTSPVNISGIDADTYPTLYVEGNFTYSGGSAVLQDWQVTVNNAPEQVTLSSPSDAATNQALQPTLQFSTTDLNSDNLQYYVQVCSNEAMTTNCTNYDQTSSQTGWSGQNGDSNTTYTSGTTASFQITSALDTGTQYFWRARAKDPSGSDIWGEYSSVFDFTTSVPPNTPTLDAPTDTATNQPLTPILQTTATDNNSDNLQYQITLCRFEEMVECVYYNQTSSQTGWSGQNADSSTTYTSGTQATYQVQTPLLSATTYYWKTQAIDPSGSNTFGATQTTPYSFTTATAPTEPGSCVLQESTDDSSLTLQWTDVASDEDGYNIERSVNGGGFTSLTDPAANATSYQDTTVSQGNTYQYRVRSYKTVSAIDIDSNWCTTSTLDLQSGTFSFEGLLLEGLFID
jgi:hypothetical protein